MAKIKIAELFAGIGGVTGGFLDAGGFDSIFLHDKDQIAKQVFTKNFPALENRYHIGCVSKLTGPVLLELAGCEIDGILGCPPCQGLSAAGIRSPNDERNELIFDMIRLVKSVRPKFFVMENVPGLLRSRYYRKSLQLLSSYYSIHGEVLNAAEYGVPQLRRRAVVIGFLKELNKAPSLPVPSNGGRGRVFDYCSGKYLAPYTKRGRRALILRTSVELGKKPLVTLEEALGDLPTTAGPIGVYPRQPRTTYQRRMRGNEKKLRNHVPWNHGKDMIVRMDEVEPGDCSPLYGARSRNEDYFSQAYSRLHSRGLARTITTNFHNPGSGRFTHYEAPRTLTLREAMRVQGFPDNFAFDLSEITPTSAEQLIGNAFPRLLAEKIARHIKTLLR